MSIMSSFLAAKKAHAHAVKVQQLHSSSNQDVKRYARSARHLDPRTPNAVLQASPAMLCLCRGAQPAPYAPLPPQRLALAVQPGDFSARPQPYVAAQVVMDLYRLLRGSYGIPDQISNEGGDDRRAESRKTGPPPPSAVPGASPREGTEDYRLSQIKRNVRHVDNRYYRRTCAYYNTREGCRKGANCEYLHAAPPATAPGSTFPRK